MNPNVWTRRLHRWGAIGIALPVLIVIATGLLLHLKKQWSWVQPPERRGVGTSPAVTFDQILAVLRTVPEAGIHDWSDVNRIDVRPSRGMLKVRANNAWEVQLDAATAEVLQVAFRRSDLIESIHDGSFFHERAKLWIFLPAGVVLLGLWLTGMYLFGLPLVVRRRKRARRRIATEDTEDTEKLRVR